MKLQEIPNELQRVKEQLRATEHFLQLGSWELNAAGQFITFSDEAARIMGFVPAMLDAWLALADEDECATLSAAFERAWCNGDAIDIEHRLHTRAGVRSVRTRATLQAGAGAEPLLAGTLHDITERKQADAALERMAARLTTTLESITDGFFTVDRHWRFTYLNREAERMLHRSRDELLGAVVWDEFKEAIGGPSYVHYHQAMHDDVPVSFEEFYPPLDKWLEVNAYPSDEGLAVHFRDISARKQAAMALARSNRALQLLSACNAALVRIDDEQALLDRICAVALEVGGYQFASVAYAQSDDQCSITIEALAGAPAAGAVLRALPHSWAHDAIAPSPAARTIREGAAMVYDDIGTETLPPAWAAVVAEQGYHGAIYLPLSDAGRTFGLLALYATESIGSASAETRLLQELADNLAFGIAGIRTRAARRRIEAALLKVAASASPGAGGGFFAQLAANMAEAVGAQGAIVARVDADAPGQARTLVAIHAGARLDDFSFALEDGPAAAVLAGQCKVLAAGVAIRYPNSVLAALGAQAYGGCRLDNSAGQLLGLLFVTFDAPLRQSDFIASTLRVFAARAAAELERQEADARIRDQAALLDKAQDAITVRAIDGRVLFWNRGAERLYGWLRDEAQGRRLDTLLVDDGAAHAAAMAALLAGGDWQGELTRRSKRGAMLTVEVRWTLVRDDAGAPVSILSIDTDISRRKENEREIRHLAFYDTLTGLPNRLLMMDRLQHAVALSGRVRCAGALLFIDLDNFKTLNDTLGHDKGDLLLQQVAARVQGAVSAADTVARFGGDEFVVMLENLSAHLPEAAAQTEAVGERVLAALNRPFTLAGYEHHSTCSIGATLFDGQQDAVGELLKRADLAMYQAKAAGRNAIRFFDPAMQTAVIQRAAMEADLRNGLLAGEFALHYQPQLDCEGRVTGAEALLRWQHPVRGMVPPGAFIALAEETGMIVPIGHWVIETACRQLAVWAASAATAPLSVSVNVSARQLGHAGFVDAVLDVLARTGADARKLKLELTESLLVDNVEVTIGKMAALKERGVGFSLDDFGTGYSSLSYLKRLPLDELKIDQAFVRDVLTDPNDAAIVRTIIALGAGMGLQVIAEGVETEAQRAFLFEHGCRAYQGYLFSRPLTAASFDHFLLG